MTLISKVKYTFFVLIMAGSFVAPGLMLAQESMSLAVTPTLFEMSAQPGQIWKSSVRVVNTNSYPITVYAEPVNFAPQGEQGHGKFLPVFEQATNGATFAEWIDLDKNTAIYVPAETTKEVSFTVSVPDDAAPGGHFAAILIGTRPPKAEGLALRTSQVVTSLFFVRIEGDVNEDGGIRTFAVKNRFVDTPKADFELRFENKGNVHLQPQGHITVYNMWGKERGSIPINEQTHFGNVLPDSIRNFEFSWEGEASIADIGRYKADVVLGYGVEEKHFQSSETYFWVIPIKATLITLGVVGLFVYLIVWMVRSYVRRMLVLAGLNPDVKNMARNKSGSYIVYEGDVAISKFTTVSNPIRFGWNDFSETLHQTTAFTDTVTAIVHLIIKYKKFFIALFALVIILSATYFYIKDVRTSEKNYQVSIKNPDVSLTLNSEEISFKELQSVSTVTPNQDQAFTLEVVNASGLANTGATTAMQLQNALYRVDAVRFDNEVSQDKTVIVFKQGFQDQALKLSILLNNSLISAAPENDDVVTRDITVYVGSDISTVQ